jgi:hypothetical protein
MQNAFLLLHLDHIQIIHETFMNKEVLFLYKQLKNKVIVLQPVTKILERKENTKS